MKSFSFPMLWLGADFFFLSLAHFLGNAHLLGKRRDGTLAWWSWLIFGPLHLYTALIWHLYRLCRKEDPFNEVTKNIVVGRRLLNSEKITEVANHVDLTSEFAEPKNFRNSSSYRSFPILDGSAPTAKELLLMVDSLKPGRTFIHCAQGHGRTGLFALALLLRTDSVATIDEGLNTLKKARPGIRLSREQVACIHQFSQLLRAT